MDVKLHIDVLHVGLHGVVGKGELLADGAPVTSASEKGAQLRFALGESAALAQVLAQILDARADLFGFSGWNSGHNWFDAENDGSETEFGEPEKREGDKAD